MSRALNVLLVEDNPGDIDLITTALEDLDVQVSVDVATDGVEALEKLRHSRTRGYPDLVLLDLKLSRKSGLEVLEEVKGDPALRTLPVVVLTSSKASADVQHVQQLQATACFAKPLRGIKELLVKIVGFVAASAPRADGAADGGDPVWVPNERATAVQSPSDAEMAALVKCAADAIIGLDADGTIRSWNAAAERLYGYAPQEAVGRSIRLILPDDRLVELRRSIAEASSEHPAYLETVRVDREGRELDVGLTISVVRSDRGDLIGYSVIARDIYGRRQAERKFELAVEASSSAMVMVDASGTIVLVNAETERQFGYRRIDLVGTPIERLVPERFRGDHPRHRLEFHARPASRAMGAGRDLYGLRKDGTEFPVEIGLNPIRTADGCFILASILDITERKHAEERFRLAVEASPSGIVMVDERGSILLVNAETERLFGYERGELASMSIDELVPRRFRGQHRLHRDGFHGDPRKRVMGSGRDLYGLRKDGTEFPVEIGLNPIETDAGIVTLSTIVDITERKQSELALARQRQELERSNADLEQFAYVASHDLQEPLRMVASYTYLLTERYSEALDERGRRFINYAQEGAERMQRLIDGLLAYSRVGRRCQDPRPVDSTACLVHALENLSVAIKEANAQIHYEPLPRVLADETLVAEVFQNLVHNAIKFRSERAPVVSISGYASRGQCIFRVTDNGIGVSPEHHQRIFQVFQRLHTREEYPGTGIGLALCKRVVEQYGGEIRVESAGTGGASFVFSFPAVDGDTSRLSNA